MSTGEYTIDKKLAEAEEFLVQAANEDAFLPDEERQRQADTVSELLDEVFVDNPELRDTLFGRYVGYIALARGENIVSSTTGEEIPAGYRSSGTLTDYRAHIPTEQFRGLVFSIDYGKDAIEVPMQELVTDTGKTIRLCDLRPHMTSSIRKGGPSAPQDIKKLDELLLKDLRHAAETGIRRNTLGSSPKISYTKFKGTKIRAYWMAIQDANNIDGIPTYARLADCGNSRALENDVLRAAFHTKLDT